MGTDCTVHRHRELVPTEDHHVWPVGLGGPQHPGPGGIRRVCANAHGSVHDLLDKMRKAPGGRVAWRVRRRYGLGVRRLAQRGYDQLPAEHRVTTYRLHL